MLMKLWGLQWNPLMSKNVFWCLLFQSACKHAGSDVGNWCSKRVPGFAKCAIRSATLWVGCERQLFEMVLSGIPYIDCVQCEENWEDLIFYHASSPMWYVLKASGRYWNTDVTHAGPVALALSHLKLPLEIKDVKDITAPTQGLGPFHTGWVTLLTDCMYTVYTVTPFKYLEGGPDREAPEVAWNTSSYI